MPSRRCDLKYVVLSPLNQFYISNYMLQDLNKADNVEFLYLQKSQLKIKNPFFRQLYDYVIDARWLSKERRKQRFLGQILNRNAAGGLVVLMTNEMLCHLDGNALKDLQEHHVKLGLILIDSLSANYESATIARNCLQEVKFDFVFTFEPQDAAEWGFEYCNTLYSVIVEPKTLGVPYDICYIGNIKDRLPLLLKLLNDANANQTRVLMKVAGCNEEAQKQLPPEAILKFGMGYPNNVVSTMQSNCIFDITQKCQTGVTLRYYEAVVYNKKLLTNNHAIKKMPFYNERYMKTYDDLKDVDWDWVKSVEKIDYGYNGEFSPMHILETIEQKMHGK